MRSLADALGTKPDAGSQESQRSFSLTSVKDFCRAILESQEYRQSLLDRITLGDLPPLIEAMLWDRACGKVVSHVTVDLPVEATPSKEQLLARIAYLQSLADDIEEDATDESNPSTSVH